MGCNNPAQVTSVLDIWVGIPEGVTEPQHEHQGHQYADYVLLGSDSYPLAVIEAKKTSKDARIGQEQARQSAGNIAKNAEKDMPFVFYTNGNDICFWDTEKSPPRKIHGFPTMKDLERLLFLHKSEKPLSQALPSTKTELLFINRIIKFLRIGGRAGVIISDGVLFGSSKAHKQARKMILDECELQGVVSMPSGVFKPYAGGSRGILIFVKGGKTEKVWFYDMKSDGYTLDDKRAKIDKKEIEENDFDLSLNRYKEIIYEVVEYEKPEIILGKI